jgi:hypothetical protein
MDETPPSSIIVYANNGLEAHKRQLRRRKKDFFAAVGGGFHT